MLFEGVDITTILIACAAALTGAALMVMHKRWVLLGFGLLVFAGSIGPIIQQDARLYGTVTQSFMQPLQMQRPILYIGGGMGLLFGTLVHIQKLRGSPPPFAGVALLLMGMFCGVMEFVHTSPESGLLTAATSVATTGVMLVCIPMLVEDTEDWQWLFRAVAISCVIWIGASALQAVVNVRGVQLGNGNRFRGMSSNPQHAATFLATASTVVLFLVVNEASSRWRMVWTCALPLSVGMLLWTGSRTGAAMLTVGVVAVLWRRFGRSILVLPVTGVGILIFLKIMQAANVDLGLERLLSTDDTRSGVWVRMIETAADSPITGVGIREAGGSENSYLLAFASYGVVSFLIAVLVLVTSTSTAYALFRVRRLYQPYYQHTIDLLLGLIAMILAGSMFEGYLVARVSVMLPLLASSLCLATMLIRTAQRSRDHASADNSGHLQPVYDYAR
jgi:hypothetical protein